MSDVALDIRHISAGYFGMACVRDVCLSVAAGQITALVGPNGAGKTTTLRAAVGELKPLSGEVHMFGKRVRGPLYLRVRNGLGYVPEGRSVLRTMTVRDNLLLGSGGIRSVIDIFPALEPLLGRRAGLLSGGEQQMLAVGRALAANPLLLLIDEMSLGLAPIVVSRLAEVVRQQAAERGVAVLIAEQRASRIVEVADNWVLMRDGRITSSGSQADAHSLNDAYLAQSPANAGTE